MDSFLHFVVTIQIYYTVMISKADDVMYGISERESFKASLEEAVGYLNNVSSFNFIRQNSNQGLKHVIETAQTLTSALQQHSQDDVYLFTDLSICTNGIIRDVLEFHSTRLQSANTIHMGSKLDFHKKV